MNSKTRLVPETAILLVPFSRSMQLRHACLLRTVSMGGPNDGDSTPTAAFHRGERGQVVAWTRTQARAAPRAFICKRDSGSDRFAILWNVRRSLLSALLLSYCNTRSLRLNSFHPPSTYEINSVTFILSRDWFRLESGKSSDFEIWM